MDTQDPEIGLWDPVEAGETGHTGVAECDICGFTWELTNEKSGVEVECPACRTELTFRWQKKLDYPFDGYTVWNCSCDECGHYFEKAIEWVGDEPPDDEVEIRCTRCGVVIPNELPGSRN